MKEHNKKMMWILVCVCFLALIFYFSTRSRVLVNWDNFVKIGGVSYTKEGTVVSADRIDEKIGKVTRKVPAVYVDCFGNVYPTEVKDGTALWCEIGTELFSVKGRDDAIAALVGGAYYLYTAD